MISNRNKIHYFILFVPVALIATQSYFKSSLIEALQEISFIPWDGINTYWVLRFVLFIVFITVVIGLSPNKVDRPRNYVDLYENERSVRDPLLGLRALACLNVFLGHWFMVVFGPNIPALTSEDYTLRLLLSFSPWCGVWIFFTLSGYLMGKGFVTGRHSTDQAGLFHFYFNRIRRIFPVYFISIFVVAVFVRPEMLDLRNQSAWNMVFESVLFDQQGGGVIGALWSVSTEFQFYLMAPFLFLLISPLLSNTKSLIALGFVIVVALCVIKYSILKTHPELWHSRVYFPVLLNLDCFVFGMITAFIVNNMRRNGLYIKNGLIIGIIVAILSQVIFSVWSFEEMASYQGFPGSATRVYYLSIAPAITTCLTCLIIFIFELAVRSGGGGGNFYWRASTFLGLITYCLYVLHEPVLLSIRRLFQANLSIVDSFFVFPFGFVLSLGVAAIFYFFIETYFDKISYSRAQGLIARK